MPACRDARNGALRSVKFRAAKNFSMEQQFMEQQFMEQQFMEQQQEERRREFVRCPSLRMAARGESKRVRQGHLPCAAVIPV
jgi:hypothetical protein